MRAPKTAAVWPSIVTSIGTLLALSPVSAGTQPVWQVRLAESTATTAHGPEQTTWLPLTPISEPSGGEAGPLPPNLRVPKFLGDVVARMWQRSATFRQQGARISAEPSLTVHVVVGLAPLPGGVRAFARLAHDRRERRVTIWMGPHDDVVELLAHELEHVIEWLDGAVYVTGSVRPRAGDGLGLIETTRAQRVGLRVASEVRASQR